MKLLIGASALSLLVIGPALATAPDCQAQLSSIKGYMSENLSVRPRVTATYNEAKRLCNDGREMQAQALARNIRATIAQALSGSAISATNDAQRRAAVGG
jgi:hypothetical protein